MTDSELIAYYGGPSKLAKKLGLGQYGVQRVSNWLTRGIPAAIKVQYPKLFLRPKVLKAKD